MKSRKWMCALVVALMALSSTVTVAKEHGQGRGKDKEKHEYRYSRRDRKEIKAWYRGYRGDLPPGLAKKDRLPPGLERQLRVRGTLLEDTVIRPIGEGQTIRFHMKPWEIKTLRLARR